MSRGVDKKGEKVRKRRGSEKGVHRNSGEGVKGQGEGYRGHKGN